MTCAVFLVEDVVVVVVVVEAALLLVLEDHHRDRSRRGHQGLAAHDAYRPPPGTTRQRRGSPYAGRG
jgi:hypothetical protein